MIKPTLLARSSLAGSLWQKERRRGQIEFLDPANFVVNIYQHNSKNKCQFDNAIYRNFDNRTCETKSAIISKICFCFDGELLQRNEREINAFLKWGGRNEGEWFLILDDRGGGGGGGNSLHSSTTVSLTFPLLPPRGKKGGKIQVGTEIWHTFKR